MGSKNKKKEKVNWIVIGLVLIGLVYLGKEKTIKTFSILPGETLICSKTTTNCGISCNKCPYSGYDSCRWEWIRKSPGEYSYTGVLDQGQYIPRWDELRFGGCSLYGVSGVVTTTTTTISETTTTTTSGGETTTTITTEPIQDVCNVNLCYKHYVTECYLECNNVCPPNYAYCKYSFVREGSYDMNGFISAGNKMPSNVKSSSAGECNLYGCTMTPSPSILITNLNNFIDNLFTSIIGWIKNLFGWQ